MPSTRVPNVVSSAGGRETYAMFVSSERVDPVIRYQEALCSASRETGLMFQRAGFARGRQEG